MVGMGRAEDEASQGIFPQTQRLATVGELVL